MRYFYIYNCHDDPLDRKVCSAGPGQFHPTFGLPGVILFKVRKL